MGKSMIDRYRTILSADPSSMVFVELAKALIDEGSAREAAEVCASGVEHHPDSIAGQVLWGRALLALGDPEAAMDHFDAAVAIDPENPYPYNLIGEVLLKQRLYRSALPLLRKAVSLQPGDARVRQWLEQAEAAVGEERSELAGEAKDPDPTTVSPALPTLDDTVPTPFDRFGEALGDPEQATDPTTAALASTDPQVEPLPAAESETTSGAPDPFADPFDAAFGAAPAPGPGEDATEVLSRPPEEALAAEPAALVESEAPSPKTTPDLAETQDESPFADYFDAAFGRVEEKDLPQSEDGILPGMTATFTQLDEDEGSTEEAPPPPAARPATGSFGVPVRVTPGAATVGADPTLATAPPPLPPPLPDRKAEAAFGAQASPEPKEPSELFGLKLPPPPGAASEAKTPAEPEIGDDTAHQVAAEYERELRARLMPTDAPSSFIQRNARWLLVGGAVALALGTATVATLYARAASRKEAIAEGLAAAHNGIARDTYQAYLAALDALDEVLDLDEGNVEARALTAEVEAILYAELDPKPERRDRAARLVADPAVAARHPDLALDARYHLLAPDARRAVGAEVLEALKTRPKSALLHYLAGRHLLATGKADAATRHFAEALKLEPGHARTVLELARYLEGLGRWKEAAEYYDNLRSNFPGHVRAQIGAARMKIERGENVEGALDVLRLVEKEHGPHLAPVEAVALELAFGRALEATGDHGAAVARLEKACAAHPKEARLWRLLAETRAAHFELPEALAAVEKAVELAPDRTPLRALEARVLLAWGRADDALARLDRAGKRRPELVLWRAKAAYFARKLVTARRALEKTRNDAGKMPAEAAVYLALVGAESGESERARVVLQRAARTRRGDPLVLWAQGRVALLSSEPSSALRFFDRALARDERAFRAATDRALALRALNRRAKAMASASKALAIDPYFRPARLLLAEMHLEAGETDPARDLFEKVLAEAPKEVRALRGLAEALLDLGEVEKALAYAQRAQKRAPKDPQVLHTLGRALRAAGKSAAAVRNLLKARRLDPENSALLTDLGWATLDPGGKRRARQARVYFEEALKIDGRSARAHWGLGRALLLTGEKDAIAELKRAVRGLGHAPAPERAAAYRDLARAYLELPRRPDLRRARSAYRASLDAEDDLDTRLALGRVLLDDGKARAAEKVLADAVAKDASSAAAHLELGKARAALKDIEGARQALDRCLALSPKGPIARQARKVLASL